MNKNFYNCIYAFDVFSPQDYQLCVWQVKNISVIEIFGYKPIIIGIVSQTICKAVLKLEQTDVWYLL